MKPKKTFHGCSSTRDSRVEALKAKADWIAKQKAAFDEQLQIIEDAKNKLKELGYQNGRQSAQKAPGSTKDAKVKVCSICGEQGHNKRSCPQAKKKTTGA